MPWWCCIGTLLYIATGRHRGGRILQTTIFMNKGPFIFDCGDSVTTPKMKLCTPDTLPQIIKSDDVADICHAIIEARDRFLRKEITKEQYDARKKALKTKLPPIYWAGHSLTGLRKSGDMLPSGLYRYDIDGLASPEEVDLLWKTKIEPMIESENILAGFKSASGCGLGFVLPVYPGMDIRQSMARIHLTLGGTYDSAVFDLTRASFAVTEKMFYFISDNLFDDWYPENVKRAIEKARKEREEADGRNADNTTLPVNVYLGVKPVSGNSGGAAQVALDAGAADSILKGAGINAKIKSSPCIPSAYSPVRCDLSGLPKIEWKGQMLAYEDIIKEYWRREGLPQQGMRNNKLYAFTKCISTITDRDPHLMLLLEPAVGLGEDELRQIISSVNKHEAALIPEAMQDVLTRVARRQAKAAAIGKDGDTDDDESELPWMKPNPMPRRLPPLVKLCLSRTPKPYWSPVSAAIFAALAAHLSDASFVYADGVPHEATLMVLNMSPASSGKDSSRMIINRIIAPLQKADDDALAAEQAWKDECASLPANTKKPKRPKLVYRLLTPDTTKAAFIDIMAASAPHRLFSYLGEVEDFDNLKSHRKGDDRSHFTILKLSFDPDNRYGQQRFGLQSRSGRVQIRWNWVANTQISVGKHYFRKGLTDGTLTRINVTTIPPREIAPDLPEFKAYDAQFDAELKVYLDNLAKVHGRIVCKQAIAMARRMIAECQRIAATTLSRTFEFFYFRAVVIAFLKACVLYAANGCKWDATIEPFCFWSLREDLKTKMTFFGPMLEAGQGDDTCDVTEHRHGPANKLEELSDTFTRADVQRMARVNGVKSPIAVIISTWKRKKYIRPLEGQKDVWEKLKFRNAPLSKTDGADKQQEEN